MEAKSLWEYYWDRYPNHIYRMYCSNKKIDHNWYLLNSIFFRQYSLHKKYHRTAANAYCSRGRWFIKFIEKLLSWNCDRIGTIWWCTCVDSECIVYSIGVHNLVVCHRCCNKRESKITLVWKNSAKILFCSQHFLSNNRGKLSVQTQIQLVYSVVKDIRTRNNVEANDWWGVKSGTLYKVIKIGYDRNYNINQQLNPPKINRKHKQCV